MRLGAVERVFLVCFHQGWVAHDISGDDSGTAGRLHGSFKPTRKNCDNPHIAVSVHLAVTDRPN
jgi:hypothetical protein